MALRQPNALASYEAEVTTPRPPVPPTSSGPAPQGRVLLHLDAGVEGVQVGVEDAQPVGLAGPSGRPPAITSPVGRTWLLMVGQPTRPP